MIYTEATPFWDDSTILWLSLSKFGLPGVRTGIVVGPPEVTKLISNANAINGLAPARTDLNWYFLYSGIIDYLNYLSRS